MAKKIQTVADVRGVVAKIKNLAAAGDHEAAHAEEDELHRAVLKIIASGAGDRPNFDDFSNHSGFATNLAKEALKTTKIKFNRWCA